MIRASICTIGDEILIGQIVDTNSSHISKALNASGIKVARMLSISDSHDDIISSLDCELRNNDIVIVTGGLGPTKDDITKYALAELFGTERFRTDESQMLIIKRILSSRGLDVLDINKAQASVPEGCHVIPNNLGTAPIMVFRFPESRYGHKATLYSLPGVPYEALGALDDIIYDIKSNYSLSDIYHKTIMTFGIAESALSKKIEEWEENLPEDIHLAYLPNQLSGVRLRLSIYEGTMEEERARIDEEFAKLNELLSDYIYSDREDTLQDCIGRLLSKNNFTVSVAESCTGGMVSHLLTSVPGSSSYYLGSVTAYSNSVKESVLNVPDDIIVKYGAVSSECAAAMADGVRELTGSDFAVSTTGIAGPGGGTDEKPVGLVWIGISTPNGTETFKILNKGDRQRNIERSSASALNFLRKAIINSLNH